MAIDSKKFAGNLLFGLGLFVIVLAINAFPAYTSTHSFTGWSAIGYLGIYFWISLIFIIAGSYLISSK